MSGAWDSIDRYVIISSDTHAGGEIRQYKNYLDRRWHDEFDTWADTLNSPFAELRDPDYARLNWDSAFRMARMDQQGVAAEIIFPNTLPPFFDTMCHLSGVPRTQPELDRRWAGLQAHNRWLVEFCAEEPQRRRGIIQLLPNDVQAAVEETRWAKDSGVIGGVMLPAVPPNHPVEPYFHSRYEPLWAVCEELAMPIHQHQGTGSPDAAGDEPVSTPIWFIELELWTRRTMTHLMAGGVFDRHPDLKVVWTEFWGISWVLDELHRIDKGLKIVQRRYAGDPAILNFSSVFASDVTDNLQLSPSEYFARNCYLGASLLPRHEVECRHAVGVDRIMWGNDFPHPEGAYPYTLEALQATLFDVPVDECRQMLAGVASNVYAFDMHALAEVASRIGPRVADVHTPLSVVPVTTSEAFATL